MNLEDIVKLHGKVYKALNGYAMGLCDAMQERDILSVPPLDDTCILLWNTLGPAEYKITNNANDIERRFFMYSLSAMTPIEPLLELADARLLLANLPKIIIKNLTGASIVMGVYAMLGLSADRSERENRIVEVFSPVYTALEEASKEDKEWLRHNQFTINDIKSAKESMAYALAVSDDPGHNALALSAMQNKFATSAEHAQRIISPLIQGYLSHQKELKHNKKTLSRTENELKQAKADIDKIRKQYDSESAEFQKMKVERDDAVKNSQDLELKVASLESVTIEDKVTEALDALAGEMKIAQDTAESKDKELSVMKKDYAVLVKELNKQREYAASLEKRLNINALLGKGVIQVSAVDEFTKRYQKLHSYGNNGPFSEIIDDSIRHLCERIISDGEKIRLNELEPAPGVFVYKRNHDPGKFTRVAFKTDFKSYLTVCDVTTPDEHNEFLNNRDGHYFDLYKGNLPFNEKVTKKLERSVTELL